MQYTDRDDSDFKIAKLIRVLIWLTFVRCVRTKHWCTAFWVSSDRKPKKPACVGLVLANSAPGMMCSAAAYKQNNISEG